METAALLRQAIKSGELPGNSRLDSVTGLAREFHTSRKVIENALKLLKASPKPDFIMHSVDIISATAAMSSTISLLGKSITAFAISSCLTS